MSCVGSVEAINEISPSLMQVPRDPSARPRGDVVPLVGERPSHQVDLGTLSPAKLQSQSPNTPARGCTGGILVPCSTLVDVMCRYAMVQATPRLHVL